MWTLRWGQSESMVNRTRRIPAQPIFFAISPVVKQYHTIWSYITCQGVVSWFSGWYWFLSNHKKKKKSKTIILHKSIISGNSSLSNCRQHRAYVQIVILFTGHGDVNLRIQKFTRKNHSNIQINHSYIHNASK